MEPRSSCVITHTKGQVGHSLSPVSPSSRFRPVWEVSFEPCAKGRVLRMESPLAPLCTSCAASARQVLFFLWLAITSFRAPQRERPAQHTCPLIQIRRGVKCRHPSGGWFPLWSWMSEWRITSQGHRLNKKDSFFHHYSLHTIP